MFNKGGKVEGRPGIDNVLAKLTSGEFIMTKETTERIGSNFFDAVSYTHLTLPTKRIV